MIDTEMAPRTRHEAHLRAEAANPNYTRQGQASAAAVLARYLAGEPLVRHHHLSEMGWSWLCPVPTCMEWRMGHTTEELCRSTWLEHGSGHPEIVPSWPAGAL
jgi:hypothetical protein